ncbi:MAG: NAD-dependent epimerase/dehydratase family protein [Phycisphaerales bacterium]|jgi:UDP-glucose 4-epimerase|nr:NAD-dependent epimerase/dehydratase family protein [Phycisphaerales bacterium]
MVFCDYNGYFAGRTVLVTGGAGFIGSHLTQHLAELDCDVRVLDDFSSGYRKNLKGIDATITEGSIIDNNNLSFAFDGCSVVFHLAAMVSVPLSIEEPEKCFEINVQGTKNVVDAATRTGCNRVVFASSAACYGPNPSLPSSEADRTFPKSPYAQSKLDAELIIANATSVDCNSGVSGVSLRYFNVFGEKQDPKSQYAAVVTAFSEAIKKSKSPVIYGDGNQTRDFVHVNNIVHANLLAASHPKRFCGEVYNVGTGKQTSLLELLSIMSNDDVHNATHFEGRAGDVRHSCADLTSITKKIGYQPIENTAQRLLDLVNPKQH